VRWLGIKQRDSSCSPWQGKGRIDHLSAVDRDNRIASTQSSFIILASASSSLQNGLQNYVNQFAPWIVVTPEGPCQLPSCAKTLPFSVIDNISSLAGVQSVYPMVLFLAVEVRPNQSIIFNGQPKIMTGYVGSISAVVGGPGSFPSI